MNSYNTCHVRFDPIPSHENISMYRQILVIVMLLLLLNISKAQETKKTEPIKPASNEVEVHFLNSSTVRMHVLSEKLEIETLYGKLQVPLKDVRSIEFGSHFPDGVEAQIAQALKNLSNSDYREREKAGKALVELGPFSYAAVVHASHAKEVEIAKRAKDIALKLQANHPKKDLKIAAEDKVVTPSFTIVGRILTPSIKAKTEYFGEVELSLAKMRTLRTVGSVGPAVEVALDAAKYANQNQWLATNFNVDGRTIVSITAKGQVDLWPEQPGQYLAGPNGYRVAAGGGFGGKAGKGGVARTNGGLLIGKIGEDGDIFIIGERYEGTPLQTGVLYLQINPSPYSQQSSGSFDVRAARKND
jgi:hypothetical protein